jgi:hypothetical protein
MGTGTAVGLATANPLTGAAAGTAAGTVAAFQVGMLLRAMDCLRAPGECSLSSV